VSPGIDGAFRDSVVAAGLDPPETVEPDGDIYRFVRDGGPRDDSG
jgi:hypothetical protein